MNRILLLEDDVSLIDGLVYSLKKNEFDVEVARTVCEAKQYLSELDRYDLLILDVTLPDGTGFDVCTIKCRKCGGADCSKSASFNGRNRLLTDSLVLRFTSIVIFCTAYMMASSIVACHLTALLRHPCAQLFYHDLHAALSRPPFVAKNSKPQFLFHFPFPVSPFRDLIPIPCQTPARFPLHQKKPGRIYAQVFD